VALFAELIATGMAWTLQPSYGRTARRFIANGFVTPEGEISQLAEQVLDAMRKN